MFSYQVGSDDLHIEYALLSPTHVEQWSAGSSHTLSWLPLHYHGKDKLLIEYAASGENVWKKIAYVDLVSLNYVWRVPSDLLGNVKIRFSSFRRNVIGTHKLTNLYINPTQAETQYEWIKVTDNAEFSPRDGAGSISFNNSMWLLGGWNPLLFPRSCTNEIWKSKDGKHWLSITPNTFLDDKFDFSSMWGGRHTAGYVVYKDKMWIVGGDANQGFHQDDIWNSTDGKNWNRVLQNPPWAPRALHHTFVFKNKLWVLGGQTMPIFNKSLSEKLYRDIWSSNDGKTWEKLTPIEPYWSARGMIGNHAIFKDKIWILGGGTYNQENTKTLNAYNDVWSSQDGVHWNQELIHAPWHPKQYHDVATFDNKIWILEGYESKPPVTFKQRPKHYIKQRLFELIHGVGSASKDSVGQNTNDVWYSSDGHNWYELKSTPWEKRHASSIFVFDHALWVVSGNNMHSDVWKLVKKAK